MKQSLAIGATMIGLLLGASRSPAVCNQPPVPGPGQTVTWMAANSPFQLCSDLTIPVGGTVIVEPGVVVDAQARQLTVNGTLDVQRTVRVRVIARDQLFQNSSAGAATIFSIVP